MADDEIHYAAGFGLRDIVGYGNTGLVVHDESSDTVIKTPIDDKCSNYLTVERLIYERFTLNGGHPGILTYHGPVENGIRLQYAVNHDIKSFNNNTDSAPSTAQRLHWVAKIAEALCFIHGVGVIHGDLRSMNVFLDEGLNPKVADFAGSSLDGSLLLIESPASYQYPGPSESVKGDLFAFG